MGGETQTLCSPMLWHLRYKEHYECTPIAEMPGQFCYAQIVRLDLDMTQRSWETQSDRITI